MQFDRSRVSISGRREMVSELKCAVADCYQEMGKPGVTDQMTRIMREVIRKIELSIALLEPADRIHK